MADLIFENPKIIVDSDTGVMKSISSDETGVQKSLLSTKLGRNFRTSGWVRKGSFVASSASYAGRVYHQTLIVEKPFTSAQICLFNADATTQPTAVAAAIAPSANMNTNYYTPSGGVGSFRNFAFGASTIPLADAAATVNNATFGCLLSDPLLVRSVARDDGGRGYLSMVRTTASTIMTIQGMDDVTGRESEYEGWAGYLTGSTLNSASAFNATRNVHAHAIKFNFEAPVVSIAAVGDSTVQGTTSLPGPSSESRTTGGCQQAVITLAKAGYPVHYLSANNTGATTSGTAEAAALASPLVGYIGRFVSMVNAGVVPEVAAFQPWSVNNDNSMTEQGVQECAHYMAYFLDLCKAKNITPILLTPYVTARLTSGQEPYRRRVCQMIRDTAYTLGIPLIDRDLIGTDYTTTSPVWKTYNGVTMSYDNTHPTLDVYTYLEAPLWVAALKKIMI